MKSKEPGTIRQLFAFVGENNGKMLLSIFLAVLGELFGIGPFLMVAVLADALYRGTATPKLVLFLCGGAAVCQIIKMLLTWRSSLMSHKISFTILKNIREAITGRMAKIVEKGGEIHLAISCTQKELSFSLFNQCSPIPEQELSKI